MVGLGGAIGSALRYGISIIPADNAGGFPFKTLLINIIGSFVIGLIAALSEKYANLSPDWILLLKTGVCGGFTTFSTFALESTTLMQSGKIGFAAIYMAASVVVSVAMVVLAQLLVR